jgi:hypothetical protein
MENQKFWTLAYVQAQDSGNDSRPVSLTLILTPLMTALRVPCNTPKTVWLLSRNFLFNWNCVSDMPCRVIPGLNNKCGRSWYWKLLQLLIIDHQWYCNSIPAALETMGAMTLLDPQAYVSTDCQRAVSIAGSVVLHSGSQSVSSSLMRHDSRWARQSLGHLDIRCTFILDGARNATSASWSQFNLWQCSMIPMTIRFVRICFPSCKSRLQLDCMRVCLHS